MAEDRGGFLHLAYRLVSMVPIRRNYSPADRKLVESVWTIPIARIVVGRTPLAKMVGVALNAVTLGLWEREVAKVGYDKIFHLFMMITLANGKSYLMEKNETPRFYLAPSTFAPGTEFIDVPLTVDTTVRGLILNAQNQMQGAYWTYDPFHNNCQDFVIHVLGDSNLLTDEITRFVKQPVSSIVENLPFYTGAVAKGVTDFSARLRTITGRGLI